MISFSHLFEVTQQIDIPHMQLCSSNLDAFLKQAKGKTIYWSPKIDGTRCWIIVKKRTVKTGVGFKKIADIKYVSRNGKLLNNLKILNKQIIELCHVINRKHKIKYPIILDVEIASPNKNLSELMTQLRRIKNLDPSVFNIHIFNLAVPNLRFDKAHKIIKDVTQTINSKNIHWLPYIPFKFSKERLDELVDKMVKSGYEGVVLGIGEETYEFSKRSKNSCKVKKTHTIDLKIVDFSLGRKGTKWEGMLATFTCDYKGKKIKISGRINNEQRIKYAKNPPIGKWVEVIYKTETPKGVFKEPIFYRIREDK